MNEADSERVLGKLVSMMDEERGDLPSASSWRRYEMCAGSYQLSLEAKRLGQEAHSAPTEASAKGDRIHGWLAGQKVELSESELTTAQFLRDRADGEVKRIFGEAPTHELIEKRFWLVLKGKELLSGQVDRLVYNEKLALIQDFKTGFSQLDEAQKNAQLKVLAVLVGAQFHKTIERVHVQLVTGPFGVSEYCYEREELAAAWDDIMATLEAINALDPPFNPGPGCRYCGAINICQAVKDKVIPALRLNYSALPEGAAAAKFLDDLEVLQNHLNEIREWYKRQLANDPDFVPGWALVPGDPRRHVSDWPAARAKLEEFIDKEELDRLALYSIPATEKLLGAAIGVRGEKLKAQYAAVLGDLLELRYPEPSLKRVKGAPLIADLRT